MSTDLNGSPLTRRRPDSRSENPVWRLYTEYGTGRRYAVMGAVATIRPGVRFVPAFVIGLAVDAIFLAERPYALPLVPDELVPHRRRTAFTSIAILLGATAAGAVASWIEDWGGASAQRVQRNLRVDAYESLQDLELAYFTGHRTGDLMSVLNNDVNALETFLEDGLSATLADPRDRVRHRTDPRRIKPPAADGSYPVTDPGTRRVHAAFHSADRTAGTSRSARIGDLELTAGEQRQRHRGHQERGAERFETERVAEASDAYLTTKPLGDQGPDHVLSGVERHLRNRLRGHLPRRRALGARSPGVRSDGGADAGSVRHLQIYAQQFLWPIIQAGRRGRRLRASQGRRQSSPPACSREPAVRRPTRRRPARGRRGCRDVRRRTVRLRRWDRAHRRRLYGRRGRPSG